MIKPDGEDVAKLTAMGDDVAKQGAKEGRKIAGDTPNTIDSEKIIKEKSGKETGSGVQISPAVEKTEIKNIAEKTKVKNIAEETKVKDVKKEIDDKKKSKIQNFDIVEYGHKTPGLENHHGVLDVWATHNIDGYKSRASKSTTIALTSEQHAATKAVYRNWLYEKTGKKVGGKVDWTSMPPEEIQALSEAMFDAANVPMSARNDYYREFNKYIYSLGD